MKLMEEIIEFDQEIKMKQQWINSRIKMLHQINKHREGKQDHLIYQFLQKIQPAYPQKLSVEYKREGDEGTQAIPLGMADVYPEAIPLSSDGVQMQKQDLRAHMEDDDESKKVEDE